ncbi:MAG TPA: hypothetical protein VE093_16295 [Polyangiaceae bacterium]|nr:hypothetical protein [Polyangiaceae bacterium]
MKTVHGSGVPGQTSDPSTEPSPTPEERTLALLASIDAGIRYLTSRLDAIERRVLHTELASPEPPSTRPPRIPPFAVRNDGKIILAVAHLIDCDLSDRERWEGIVLNEAEVRHAVGHLADLFDDTAARTAGRFLLKGVKRKPEGGREEPNP